MTSPIPLADDLTLHTRWIRNALLADQHQLTIAHVSELTAHIWPIRLWDRLAIQLGSRDVQTSDEDFDRTFRVDCDQVSEIQALLSPSIRDQMRELHKQQAFRLDLTAEGFTAAWSAQARYRDETFAAFVMMLRTLVQQDTVDWYTAARERGLEHTGWTLSGELSGVPITARIVRQLWKEHTEISVPIPTDFTVSHPSKRRWRLSPPLSTGNPVLDSTVVIDGSPDDAARLHDPALALALLEVVHRWPDSTVSRDGILLRADGRLTGEIGEALDAAARLGSMLAA